MPGQLGLEPTFSEYLSRLVGIFEEVRRVLRKDGTCWVNMGDSYAGSWGAQSRQGASGAMADRAVSSIRLSGRQIEAAQRRDGKTGSLERVPKGIKAKDLLCQPWRLAFALQDAGWWLRSDIIWAKPNPMPESVTDRPTKAHEYLFLLAKSARYHYDAKAIAEPATSKPNTVPDGWATGPGSHDVVDHSRRERSDKQSGHGRRHAGFNDRWDASEQNGSAPLMRNARSVWTIATSPFPEAHFATFPPELPRRCILAGSRPGDLVLDPFSGAGTTGLVSNRLGRDFVGIELNPQYAAMARRRIAADAPLFNERSEP